MNPWSGIRDIPRNIWLISAATLINRSGMMVLPFLALYLTQEIGVSAGDAGLVLTFYGLGALVSAPFAGKLSDKIGSLNLMKISLLVSGAFFFLYSFIDNYFVIIFISIFLAVISEAFRPASMAFISDHVPAEQRKPAFALYRLAINLGMSIGPVLGGFLSVIDFSLLFYVDGITSILAGLYLIIIKWNLGAVPEEHPKSLDESQSLHILKDKKYIFFLFAMLPAVMVFFQHMSSMPLFLVEDLGYARSTFGILIGINTVLIILIEVPLNNAMKNWADWKSLALGALLCGMGFGAMAFSREMTAIVITIIIWTFGEMIFFPAGASYAAGAAPKERRGEYMGYFQMMFGLSFTIAPWLGTKVFEVYGSFALWTGTFVFGLISSLMMLRFKNRSIKNGG